MRESLVNNAGEHFTQNITTPLLVENNPPPLPINGVSHSMLGAENNKRIRKKSENYHNVFSIMDRVNNVKSSYECIINTNYNDLIPKKCKKKHAETAKNNFLTLKCNLSKFDMHEFLDSCAELAIKRSALQVESPEYAAVRDDILLLISEVEDVSQLINSMRNYLNDIKDEVDPKVREFRCLTAITFILQIATIIASLATIPPLIIPSASLFLIAIGVYKILGNRADNNQIDEWKTLEAYYLTLHDNLSGIKEKMMLRATAGVVEEQHKMSEEQSKMREEQSKMREEQHKMSEEQRKMSEEQRKMREEQIKMCEEQRKMREEQSKMYEEQRQVREEQRKICEELRKICEKIDPLSETVSNGMADLKRTLSSAINTLADDQAKKLTALEERNNQQDARINMLVSQVAFMASRGGNPVYQNSHCPNFAIPAEESRDRASRALTPVHAPAQRQQISGVVVESRSPMQHIQQGH